MSTFTPDDDHLMVSYIDERAAIDAVARLVHDDPPAVHEFSVFPFDDGVPGSSVPIIAYSVPPVL